MAGVKHPVLLLPGAKGKVSGGAGPTYGEVVAGDDGALGPARRAVLTAARAAADDLEPAALARLTGVGVSRAEQQRVALRGLADAATLPAHRRYDGVVHANAGLADLDRDRLAAGDLGIEVLVISPLLGVLGLDERVPAYRLELTATLPPLGGLAAFWRPWATQVLEQRLEGRRVWDLLPGEHARVWPVTRRAAGQVARVAFVRPDGRAANAARTKVAKGRLAGWLIAHPTTTVAELVGSPVLGEGWQVTADAEGVRATWTGG